MIIACPKCQQRHDVRGRKSGEAFACTCGNMLAAPEKKSVGWIIALAVIGSIVAMIVAMVAVTVPSMNRYNMRARASEARFLLVDIRKAEMSYFNEHGEFRAAGPVPAIVPKVARERFEQDLGFKEIAFKPEGTNVSHQFEVRVTGPRSAVAMARGDLDGNGKVAEYSLEISADGPDGVVKKADEDEY